MVNIKLAIEFVNDFPVKPLTYNITQERLDAHPYSTYNHYIWLFQVFTQLPDMAMFGQTTKFINHPKLMPILHLMETEW